MAQARMIDKKISVSEQVANLTLPAQLLFTWMIPHADDFGLLPTSPRTIKALIIPMIEGISWQDVESFIGLMLKEKLLKEIVWKNEKFYYLTGFSIQKLRKDIKPHSIAKDISEWDQFDTIVKQPVTDAERHVTGLYGSAEEVKGREVKLREGKLREDNIYTNEKNSEKFSEIKKQLGVKEPSKTGINHEFQEKAMQIIKALEIPIERKSAYFKAVKEESRSLILAAYSFAVDHPTPKARDKMFFWKLNELKKGKNAKLE